ncbi:MAG: helix-turn-helix domain-containing protein [Micromonosporaceae bacterium]
METTPSNETKSAGGLADLLLTVEEAAKRLRIGRTSMYALVSRGVVESVLIGRLRRIPIRSLHKYVESLVSAQLGPATA